MTTDAPLVPVVTMTTDGASIGNPGAGGWAVLLEYGTTERLLSGPGSDSETNNRMELQAVIEGLRALKKPCAVTLRADSQYVLNGMQQILDGRSLVSGMKNGDQWHELAELMQPHTFTLQWVRGHADDARNNRVDQAAAVEAQAVLVASPTHQAEQQRITAIIDGLQMTDRWTLVVAAPPASQPSRWRLYTPDDIIDGVVHERNSAVAAWRTFIAGLDAALEQSEELEEAIALDVLINADVVVKQATGIWSVEHPRLVPLAEEWAALQEDFSEVVLIRAADTQVLSLVTDPD